VGKKNGRSGIVKGLGDVRGKWGEVLNQKVEYNSEGDGGREGGVKRGGKDDPYGSWSWKGSWGVLWRWGRSSLETPPIPWGGVDEKSAEESGTVLRVIEA